MTNEQLYILKCGTKHLPQDTTFSQNGRQLKIPVEIMTHLALRNPNQRNMT